MSNTKNNSRTRYPTPEYRRIALAPSIIGTIVLLAGVALVDSDGYLVIQFIVAIFALIIGYFAWQAKQWWWIIPLVAIAVVWNPVFPITIDGDLWLILHYVAAIVFIAAGVLIKVRNEDDKNRRQVKGT